MLMTYETYFLQVEYRPCVLAESCWELLMEFTQGILGQHAQTAVPRCLQVKTNWYKIIWCFFSCFR